MKIAVSGGTGFVGRAIAMHLLQRGDAVSIITRDPDSIPAEFHGHVDSMRWLDLRLHGFDAVVHLSGENLFSRRWNEEQKRRIRESRIGTTERIVAAIAEADPKPKILISASAIGYYGSMGESELDENSPPGSDYLASVAVDWEAAANAAKEEGCRVVNYRIGVVLGRGGGAIESMSKPFRRYLGGRIGSGRQWFSWIHVRDVAHLCLFAIDHEEIEGPLNATAPNPVRMGDLASSMGEVLGKPCWLPAPSLALRLAVGGAAEVILSSTRVRPRKALEAGFQFEFEELRPALEESLNEPIVP